MMVMLVKLQLETDSILKNLVFLKQADEDKNFEPLYAKKSQPKAGITIRQPYWTISKYGHFGQKMDFLIDFIFRKYTFLEKTRDDKHFELSYAKKTQSLADLVAQMTIFDHNLTQK